MPAPAGSVKEAAQGRLKKAPALEDDPEREVQRATRADERARELQVGAGVDEEPRVLVAEPEPTKLVEAPAHDALILERSLEGLRWVLRRRHTSFNEQTRSELLAERKAWLRTGCARLRADRVRVARRRAKEARWPTTR
jgi:hypothetical protein